MTGLDEAPPGGAAFGLYVHWPFCQSKCPYCDFNSHVSESVDQSRWQRAYLTELERLGRETVGRSLRSVFFGGGTPSLMSPDTVYRMLDKIRSIWSVANNWEVTLEANPSSVEAGKFREFRFAGVNRLSMGIQALNDDDLRRLGRLHSVREAEAAFEIARKTYDRVSFDLIYARQDQTPQAWEAELTRAVGMAIDHLSLYQLTIEDGTAFGARHASGGLKGLPDEDRSVELYSITQHVCDAAGLPAYEVSNHAKDAAQSEHNLIYWRGGEYAGVGPGAHGRLTLGDRRWATEAIRSPGEWLQRVELAGNGELPRTALTPAEQALEYLMMSMRLTEGMNLDRLSSVGGKRPCANSIAELTDMGLISASSTHLKATAHGRMILNAIIRRLAETI